VSAFNGSTSFNFALTQTAPGVFTAASTGTATVAVAFYGDPDNTADTVTLNGSGSLTIDALGTCPTSGNIKFVPPLAASGDGSTTIAYKSKTAGACTGGSGLGAHVKSWKVVGGGLFASNRCNVDLHSTQTNTFTLTVTWKTDKTVTPLNPSTITITSETGGVAADGHATYDTIGTVTAGPFLGANVSGHAETDQTAATLTSQCNAKGVKKMSWALSHGSDHVKGSASITIS
jgi:hypothetical protein